MAKRPARPSARTPAPKPAKAPARTSELARPSKGKVAAAAPANKPAPKPVSKPAKPRSLPITTQPIPGSRYEARIGRGILPSCFEGLIEQRQRALLVIDANLPRSLVEPLLRSLDIALIRWGVRVVSATEADKSLATLEGILVEAARLRLERRDVIIALGGGIVTDLAGFAASIYRRGVSVIQCPTTLLAMVDASVGGKTAANLNVPHAEPGPSSAKPRLVKNLIGAFHQPARVVIDTDALASLTPREFHAGLAECIKHTLIGGSAGDPALLTWTAKNLPAITNLDHAVIAELVARNIALKARVVRGDERELSTKPDGGRMMLNLGHTFAHAIETLSGLAWRDPSGTLITGSLKHGEAVALGLLAAARVSAALKLCEHDLPARLHGTLKSAGLPTALESMPAPEHILERMGDDKKVAAGKLRLILPVRGLKARVRDDVPAATILSAIAAWRANDPRA